MVHSEERRKEERFGCGLTLEWAYFNKSETYGGRLSNFSRDGFSFECGQALVEGATILIRLQEYQPECRPECPGSGDCPWPRSMVVGDVKWCRGILTGGSEAPVFEVGVRLQLPM
jgi:hypothetical protein